MAVSEELTSQLLKLALKRSQSDAGMVLVYRRTLFWVVLMASLDEDRPDWIQMERSNFHLDLHSPLGNYNLQKCTFLPLSILSEVMDKGTGLDWPWIEQEQKPLLWSATGEAPLRLDSLNFEGDPHLRWIQGRSLCCVPVWADTPSGPAWKGLIYLEGNRREPLPGDMQTILGILGEQLIAALELEEESQKLVALSPLAPVSPVSPLSPLAPELRDKSPPETIVPSEADLRAQIEAQTQALRQANQDLSIEAELNRRITELAKRFVEVDFHRIDEEIHFALEEIGCICQADCAFIFQFTQHPDSSGLQSSSLQSFSMTHEWCLDVPDRRLHLAQNLPRRKFPWASSRLIQGETIVISDLNSLPETATIDRVHWEQFGVQAVVCVPLRIQGRPLGWLGVADFQGPRDWSDADLRLLQSLAEIFSYTLHQQQVEQKLRDQTEALTLTMEANEIGIWEIVLTPDLKVAHLHGSLYWQELLGFGAGNFDGNFHTFLAQVHPDDRHLFEYGQGQSLKEGQGSFEYRISLPLSDFGQNTRWLRHRYRVSYDAEGHPVGLMGLDENITEKKALQQDRDRLFALSNDLLCIVNTEGYFVQVNPAFERVLGYSFHELTDRPYLEFVHPDDRPATLAAAQRLARGESIQHFENRYRCQDGSYRWLSWNTTPLPEANAAYATARDVTEQKAITAALAEREALLQAMNNNLPGVIYRYELYPDGSDALTYANSGSVLIWELSPEVVMGNCSLVWEQVHPEDFPAMQASVMRSATHLTRWIWEWRLINPSGRQIWVQGQAMPQRLADGTIVWDGIILDVSDRKLAEQALQESEIQYRRIVETTTEGIWIVDQNNVTTFVNAQMAAMLGYTPGEMLDKNLLDFMDEEGKDIARHPLTQRHQDIRHQDIQHPDIQHPDIQYPDIQQQDIQHPDIQHPDIQYKDIQQQHDFKFQRRTGEVLWAIVSAQPIFDEQGNYRGTLAMLTDITERKRAEDQLRQYERVVGTTSDAIAVVDRQYVYQMVNQAYLHFRQKAEDEIIGHTVAEIMGQELFETVIKAKVDDCFAGNRVEYDLVQDDPQGQPCYRSVVYVPYVDSTGTVSGLLASIRDLTEQKKTQNALSEAQARYQIFLETAVEGFLIVSAKPEDRAKLLDVNPAYCKMVGYSRSELLQMHISDLEVLENPAEIQAHLQKVRQDGSHCFETCHRRKDGKVIDLAASKLARLNKGIYQ